MTKRTNVLCFAWLTDDDDNNNNIINFKKKSITTKKSKPLFNSHHDRINKNARSATGCTDGRLACSAFYIVFGLLTNRRCMSLDDCVSQEEEGEQGEGGRGEGAL